MEINISKGGLLNILRGNEWKSQFCPYYAGQDDAENCGDWCPLFGEPEKVNYRMEIELCHGKRLIFDEDEFSDNRK